MEYLSGKEEYFGYSKRILNEEIFHTYNNALAKAFPTEFGAQDFNSIACKEMARLECMKPGWHH